MARRHTAVALAALSVAAGLSAAARGAVVAFYNFDTTGTPTSIPDNSGGGHTGTPGGNAAYAPGVGAPIAGGGGSSFTFNGTADRVQLAVAGTTSFANVTANNAVTVAFWEKGSVNQNQTDFDLYDTGGARQVQAHVPWGDGTVYFDTGGSSTGPSRISQALPAGYDAAQWHHFALVKNGSTKTIYLDGNLLATSSTQTAAIGTIAYAAIGNGDPTGVTAANPGTFNEGYHGNLDEFIVFDNALTQTQVQTLMTQGGQSFVPEPGSLGLLGLAALGLVRRRSRRRALRSETG